MRLNIKNSIKVTIAIMMVVLFGFSPTAHAAYTWSQGGTNNVGPYASSTVIVSDGTKFYGIATSSLGFPLAATPGGSNTNIQFNNSGVFGGTNNANLDTSGNITTTGTLSVANTNLTVDTAGDLIVGPNNTANNINPAQLVFGNYQTAGPGFPEFVFNTNSAYFMAAGANSSAPDEAMRIGGINNATGFGGVTPWAPIGTYPISLILDGGFSVGTATLAPNGGAIFTNNVGIGTDTPGTLLSLGNSGGINFQLSTSTFGSGTNGIDIQNGCFSIKGICIGGGGGGTVGAGTQGQFPYYAANGTTLTATSTVFLGTNGNVGIGSTSPNSKLSIVGDSYISGNLFLGNGLFASATGTRNYFLGSTTATTTGFLSGADNIFFGNGDGMNNINGTSNIFMGGGVGLANTGGSFNLFQGNGAGAANTTGSNNIFQNVSAGAANTTGNNNIFQGSGAGRKNTTGSNNTFLGLNVGSVNTTGADNVFIGDVTGGSNTVGSRNIYQGANAASANKTGSNNIEIGFNAGQLNGFNATSSNNTFVGYQAGNGVINQTNSNNSLFGYQTGYNLTTGSNNLILGYNNILTGGITSGSQNIILGDTLTKLSPTGSNNLDIGNLIFGTGIATGSVLSTGTVGIATSTPDSTLDVNGSVRFEGTSSFETTSISGAIIGIGCDTADTTGLSGLASTTAFVTTPESFPGNGLFTYTMALNPTSARTFVCSAVTVTPNASTYVVKVIR